MYIGGANSVHLAAYQAKKAYSDAAVINIGSDVNGVVRSSPRARSASDTFTLYALNDSDERIVGGWGGLGASATVYKPRSFREDDPIYRVKVWDDDGHAAERRVPIRSIDPSDADEVEMLVYSSHLTDSGKLKGARRSFMAARAYRTETRPEESDPFSKTNWLNVVSEIMQKRYMEGDMEGFSEYKSYWDFLSELRL